MTQFHKKLKVWLAKLAFWRKRAAEAGPQSEAEPEAEPKPKRRAAVDDAEPASEAPVVKPGVLARLKSLFTFRRRKIEATADTVEEAKPASDVAREPKKRIRATETPEAPEIPQTPPSLFTRLKQWLSFRSKAVETAAESNPEDVVEKPLKKKTRATDEPEEPEVPESKPNFFSRLKRWLSFRSKAAETEAEPSPDDVVEMKPKKKTRATDEPEEPEVPEPKPGVFARLKQSLSFRRKSEETEADANDKTLVIDKAKVRSETKAAEGEEEAPPPSRLKRLLIRLRNKWIWIPALSLAVVGLVSWVVVLMMHATHEKERLQAELKAAKKMLEQKQVVAVKPPVPPPLSTPTEPVPVKPEKKIDPAFAIVGHGPAPQPEEESGMNTSDCVVKDKKSVAENLKNCIASFNDTVASTSQKPKKP
ncbi:MAG: hypothetical protein Q8L39_05915 [Burkholderiales bacterium]|nr:hypothetical protein [Burkholderiales bacterium]